jgi:hypothetical protein
MGELCADPVIFLSSTMLSKGDAISCTHVKPGYNRTQHYHCYGTAKAYGLARMYSEMYGISEFYSTQYCSLLAELQVVDHFKRSEAAIAYFRVLNAYKRPFDGVKYASYHLDQASISFTPAVLPNILSHSIFNSHSVAQVLCFFQVFTCVITSNHFRTPTIDTRLLPYFGNKGLSL